jgi:hypothetical protein
MAHSDRQKAAVTAGLDLLKAVRLKEIHDGELARLREAKASALADIGAAWEKIREKSPVRSIHTAAPSGEDAELKSEPLRLMSIAAGRGEDIDREICRVQAQREATVKMFEAAAAAATRLVIDATDEPPAKAKHPGGRPPEFDWHLIDRLTGRDVWENGLPKTIAEMVDRMLTVCRENGLAEPSEETVKPKARGWCYTLWRGPAYNPEALTSSKKISPSQ